MARNTDLIVHAHQTSVRWCTHFRRISLCFFRVYNPFLVLCSKSFWRFLDNLANLVGFELHSATLIFSIEKEVLDSVRE